MTSSACAMAPGDLASRTAATPQGATSLANSTANLLSSTRCWRPFGDVMQICCQSSLREACA
eukprot:4559303-Alexandrium_andersonii.AAC.1